MGSIGESLHSLAMIFLMIVPGIVMSKKKILSEVQVEGINSLVANLTWPCLVIDAMQMKFSIGILKDCGYSFVLMTVVFVLAWLLSKLLVKIVKMKVSESYLFTFMLIFANTGFMGIPVINALYGKQAVFYASIVEMINDIFLFTVGIMLIQLSAGKERKMNLQSMLSPGIIGVVIGFSLFLLNIKLPGVLGQTIGIIGAATTPLSMIVIGLQIGRQSVRQLLGDGKMYLLSCMKLLAIPGAVFIVMIFMMKDTSLLARVLILEFAMPVAACTVIFAGQYKADIDFSTRGVLLSTVLSIATLPVFTVLLSVFT